MPRSLKELKNFNIGNVTNADSREVPNEGAAMSRGIDPNAPNGILRGNYQEDYKGNSVNYAKYKVDTGIVLDGATNNTDTTHTFSSVEGLAIGDWVSIGAYAFQILSINSATRVITTGTTYRWGGFGSTIAVGDGTIVYKIPTPKQLTTYVKDKDNDVENVIIFDKEGSINGIEDLQTNTSGTLGAGVNTTFVSDDFTNFPLSMKHGGDISITKRGLSYYLGTGKQTKSKWLGKVGDLALNNKKGFILEDSELYAPDYGSGNNAYDKIVTYQYVTTSSSTLLKTPLINNETGVFHAAFIKGEQWIYIIDGDSGFVNKSIDIGFPITAIAKVTSCVTDARIWLYEEIDDLNTFATKPGKIHCYEIFDLGGTELINLETSTGYPIGIPLTFKHEHDCHWGQTYATGYPSHPIYAQGIHQTDSPNNPVPIPEVTDILETVTSGGAGKLWILASPQGNNEHNEWFRTSLCLERTRMLLHRFMWSSYNNIDGDLADGTTVTTYFNDKSMPLAHLVDNGVSETADPSNHVDYLNCMTMDIDQTNFSIRLMKRSVPSVSISGYTEPAKPVDNGLQDYSKLVTWNSASGFDDGETRLFNLVNGGSYWYSQTPNFWVWDSPSGTAANDAILDHKYDLTDCTLSGGATGPNLNYATSSANQTKIEGENRWGNFKPMPYSLVDVSDLYDGVDHVVGCVVKMSDTTNPLFLEDMWITHHDTEGGSQHHRVTKGLRLNGMAGKSFLWISNAGRNNYGALYNKSNSFGYDTSDGSDADHFDGLNLSTLCFDKGDNVVRQMKVLGDVIPSTGIASISRNKATHEYNVFNKYNDGDSRFSGLFISFIMEGTLRGLAVRLNTSVEQGDTIDGITDYNGNEVVIIGDHEAGLAGYADSEGTAGSGGIIDNPGTTDSLQQYPANQLASAQSNGAQSVSNLSSLTVETLASHAGINGSPEAPNEVFPDGPGVISYFDTTNFLRKVWYNRSSATTLSNLYTEAEHSIADNRAIILRGENFQKAFIVDQGPYEGVSTTDFPDNGTVTKFGYIQPPGSNLDFTPSNIDTEDTDNNMIAYVWPKGEPAKSDGTEADDEGRHSQYRASDYYFTYFNKGSKNNLTFGGLSSIIGGGISRINNFGEASTNDFMYRMYINRLYQYTKYATLEFTDGEDHSEDTHGDFPNFPSAITRHYKISYEYDGFQDSPITSSVYTYKNTTDPATDKHSVDIKIKIPFELNQRVSAVTLWRRGGIENDTVGEAYVRVARLKLQKGGGWIKVEEASGIFYEQEITDNLIVGQTYQDYTGISETILNSNLNYSVSINAGDRLYVAGIKHALLPEGDNSLAWSKIGKFSMFDIQSDRIDLGSEVTALAVFNNTLFAFALDRIYKIDTNTNSVIDIIEGFGCSNKDSVVVTEYGMFFADKNHIYKYDGTAVTIISYPIDIDANGSDGWTDVLGNVRLYFSSKFNLLIALKTVATSTTRAFTYHVLKKRWDFRRFEVKDGSSNFNPQSIVNNILIPSKLGGNLYAFTGAEGKGDESTDQSCKLIEVNKGDEQYGQIYWESKDFTMGADTNDKRFIKIKVEASAALTTAPVVYIDGLLNTLVSSGTNEWKIKKNSGTGAVQKGKKIKVQLNSGNDNKEIYSIGIVYRVLKVK